MLMWEQAHERKRPHNHGFCLYTSTLGCQCARELSGESKTQSIQAGRDKSLPE